jgi:cytochrome c oxidase subunit 4
MTTQHVVERRTYLLVFAALIVLTATTVGIANIDLGPFNTVVALVIAAMKASLVILFFMHARYSKPLIGLVAFAAVMWLGILIVLTLTDFISRPWTPTPHGL